MRPSVQPPSPPLSSTRYRGTAVVGALALCLVGIAGARSWTQPGATKRGPDLPGPAAAEMLARVPAAFVPNVGQWQHDARFVARIGGTTAFLEDDGFVVGVRDGRPDGGEQGAAVRLRFAGAQVCRPRPEEPLAGTHSYFLGDDPARWRSEVSRFGKVRWSAPWPGIDVACYERGGHLEYSFELAPGADAAQVEIEVEGAEGLSLDADGALVIETGAGPLHQPAPVSWQVAADGAREPVVVHYELRGQDRFGIRTSEWDGEHALVVDPGLVYATYVGGSAFDAAFAMHVDASGLITIGGQTVSPGFPTTLGTFSPTQVGDPDGFIARIDPSLPTSQQLVAATFLGGAVAAAGAPNASDRVQWYGLVVDPAGVITVAGYTKSADFPTTPGAFRSAHSGDEFDAYVAQLDGTLSQLLFSTYLGGADLDSTRRIATDPSTGLITVLGTTKSADFPTTPGTWNQTYNGDGDNFLSQLDPSLQGTQQLVYSTFIGGQAGDHPENLSLHPSGQITFCGWTDSPDYPTTAGAFSRTRNASIGFVSTLDPSLPQANQLVYSTFLGGSGFDDARAIHVDAAGLITVAGQTYSSDFPTTANGFDRTWNGPGQDVFVTQLDPSLQGAQQLQYSTYIGGSLDEFALDLTVDARGVITVVGESDSRNFPTTPRSYDRTHNGSWDAILVYLDPGVLPRAQQLLYSSYFGGSREEHAWGVHIRGSLVTIAGRTDSANLPTTPGAWDTTHNSDFDAFVAQIEMSPIAAVPYGPSCGVTMAATTRLAASGVGVTLDVTGGAPSQPAVLLIGVGRTSLPLPVPPGCSLLTTPVLQVPTATDPSGAFRLGFVVPNLEGVLVDLQAAVADARGLPVTIATSNGLELTDGL